MSQRFWRKSSVDRFPTSEHRSANVEAMVAAGSSYDCAHLMNDAWDTFSHYGLLRDEKAESSRVMTIGPSETMRRADHFSELPLANEQFWGNELSYGMLPLKPRFGTANS